MVTPLHENCVTIAARRFRRAVAGLVTEL